MHHLVKMIRKTFSVSLYEAGDNNYRQYRKSDTSPSPI